MDSQHEELMLLNTYPIGKKYTLILVGKDNINILCKFQHLKRSNLSSYFKADNLHLWSASFAKSVWAGVLLKSTLSAFVPSQLDY